MATASPTSLTSYLSHSPSQTIQFGLRLTTFITGTLFLLSGLFVSYPSGYQYYRYAFLAALTTFAIRFHQRMKENQVSLFSRACLTLFTVEDSGHYILYSLFFYNHYIAMFILPIYFYSILFVVKFIKGMEQFLPGGLRNLCHKINTVISSKQADIHRFIAYCEILNILFLAWKIITGHIFITTLFVYYYFLKLRYTSRRNASVRTVFSEIHEAVVGGASHPNCPTFLSTIIHKVVGFVSRLNPMPPGTTHNPQNPS